MIAFKTVPTNEDLHHICEQQWNEIEYLKQENEELKKDIAELSKMVDNLHSTIEKSIIPVL
jgi:cell division septum initiation protein DivIVA